MNVQFDVLDDVLNTIRLSGTVYFQQQFVGNWGLKTPTTPYKKFQIIVQGECWLQAPFLNTPVRLQAGDIAAFPHGSPYQLSAQLDSPCISISELLASDHQPMRLPMEGTPSTTIIFGHVEFTRDFNHPFMTTLPPLIHISTKHDDQFRMLRSVANLIIEETIQLLPGSGSIAHRLAEVLHLHMLRAHVLQQKGAGSFPAVFDEPAIYQSLQLIHNHLDENWTLEDIATKVNLSRTSFATRFQQMIGIPPMRYITMWRMQKARELLEMTNHPLIAVALKIGYGSEAAFSRAFKQEFNETPGRYRQKSAIK